jgi:hypothetical protein
MGDWPLALAISLATVSLPESVEELPRGVCIGDCRESYKLARP